MAWFNWLLFESFAALLTVAALLNFCLLVHWRRGGSARPLLGGLALSAVLLVVQALVVTQREHAERVLEPITEDLVKGRVVALQAALAPQFTAGRLDGDGLVQAVQRRLSDLRIRSVQLRELQVIESSTDEFKAAADYHAEVSTRDLYSGPMNTRWTITFMRTGDGWKIRSIDPPRIEGIDLAWEQVWD